MRFAPTGCLMASDNSRLHCQLLYPRKILISAGRHPKNEKDQKRHVACVTSLTVPSLPTKFRSSCILITLLAVSCLVLPCQIHRDEDKGTRGEAGEARLDLWVGGCKLR